MPLEQHQIQQAAYHMGAFVVGDEVTSPRRLATAGQTVHDVRLLLKHGRGNVKADDIPSHGHNGIGSSVALRGIDATNKVARAVLMGAAVCDQTAPLSAIVHAPHMAANEFSTTYAATVPMKQITDEGDEIPVNAAHTWNELWRESRDTSSTVVMDAWANGPAVRLKDSAWGREPAWQGPWSMDKSEAEFLKNRVEGLIPLLHPDSDDDVRNDLRRKHDAPTSYDKYAEPQVISPEFAKSVRTALSRFPEDKKTEIASRMIREAFGMDPNQNAVQSVLVSANQLDSLPRPPVVPSEYSTARGSNRPVAEPRGAANARADLASSTRSRERSSRGR
ncbi:MULTISPECIES: type III secretion protein [Mesorhizobium]|uniref:type III secretion protein n=1 Tax=Mesorhizobium TaxID=68287 RepID=UPI001596E014|nr:MULTISPECIES: type III secretion protein [Mesorhizobium]